MQENKGSGLGGGGSVWIMGAEERKKKGEHELK